MPLLYNGELTLYNHGFNANYAVIYKLNIEGFTGSNIYLEYSEYTSPSHIVGSDDGIFVACSVNGKTPNLAYLKRGSTEKFNIPISYEENIDYVYIVVSGMSSMPLTVRFE